MEPSDGSSRCAPTASSGGWLIAPHLSLAEARREARRLIADPPKNELNSHLTFADAVDQFVARWSKPRCRSWKEIERILTRRFPSLMSVPVTVISRRHISEAVAMIAAPAMANKSLAFVKSMFSWLTDQGYVDHHPCLRMSLPAPKVARDRVLSDQELARIWRATFELDPPHGVFYRLLLLLGQRKTETALMQRADIADGVWSIPAAHSKNKKPHLVPLSRQAMAELDAMPRVGHRLFPPPSWRLKERLVRLAGVPDWRGHDLRRTAATGMATLGIAPHVIERILNHSGGIVSGVAAIYNRHSYVAECKDALQLWADHVVEIAGDRDKY